MKDDKLSIEEAFKASLEDVIAIAMKMNTHCKSVDELVGMCQLALENDGQLRLLLSLVNQAKR